MKHVSIEASFWNWFNIWFKLSYS